MVNQTCAKRLRYGKIRDKFLSVFKIDQVLLDLEHLPDPPGDVPPLYEQMCAYFEANEKVEPRGMHLHCASRPSQRRVLRELLNIIQRVFRLYRPPAAEIVLNRVRWFLDRPSAARLHQLIKTIREIRIYRLDHDFVNQLVMLEISSFQQRQLGLWLSLRGKTFHEVKLGLRLLHACAQLEDMDFLRVLGKDDLLAADVCAIMIQVATDPEKEIWKLASCYRNHGLEYALVYLQDAEQPEIQDWLLSPASEPYCLPQCGALSRAVGSRMAERLSRTTVEDWELLAALEIVYFLISAKDGYDAGIDWYKVAPDAIAGLIRHCRQRPMTARMAKDFRYIAEYLREKPNEREVMIWQGRGRLNLARLCEEQAARAQEPLAGTEIAVG